VAHPIRLALTLALAVLFASPCFAQSQTPLAKGFGQAAWGDDLLKKPGFMKLRSSEGTDYFVNLRETYEMPGYGKPTAFYGQSRGRLFAVILRLKDGTDREKLLAELRQFHGPGKSSGGKGAPVTAWKAGQVRIKLKTDPGGAMKLGFYYMPLAGGKSLSAAVLDPLASDLDKLSAQPQLQSPPPGAVPAAQAPKEAIDVLGYLRQGGKIIRPAKQ
jgi:hypothetical protein